MPRFPDVRLCSAEYSIGCVVPLIITLHGFIAHVVRLLLILIAVHVRPIITGVDHQGVVRNPYFAYGIQNRTHCFIHLHDKVSIRPQTAFTYEARVRQGRLVGAVKGKYKKKGSSSFERSTMYSDAFAAS